jgi:hypothetical protein
MEGPVVLDGRFVDHEVEAVTWRAELPSRRM